MCISVFDPPCILILSFSFALSIYRPICLSVSLSLSLTPPPLSLSLSLSPSLSLPLSLSHCLSLSLSWIIIYVHLWEAGKCYSEIHMEIPTLIMLDQWQVLRQRGRVGRLHLRHGRFRWTSAAEHGGTVHARQEPMEPHSDHEPPTQRCRRHNTQR